jgi:YHS domain-containing protein
MKSIKRMVGILVLPAVFALFVTACSNGANKTEAIAKDTMTVAKDTSNIFEHMLVDNVKDPSCGMPVTAGISDTAHYKDKLLGFCSTECKDAFKKDPDAMIAAAEIKK